MIIPSNGRNSQFVSRLITLRPVYCRMPHSRVSSCPVELGYHNLLSPERHYYFILPSLSVEWTQTRTRTRTRTQASSFLGFQHRKHNRLLSDPSQLPTSRYLRSRLVLTGGVISSKAAHRLRENYPQRLSQHPHPQIRRLLLALPSQYRALIVCRHSLLKTSISH